ncbi:NAD-dependent epimerase/dehydratase family protein [Paenibacillus sp. NEAU-GSW1]|uniref:NAD-dependent epimerase/dehydratase family protein n=1 Tax=Paenibacillus sp. NEAU-GSW1 TaxID=2682486 RepID=UPI0012E1FFA7|nr:NAD-dependent epimerase/dehydratase family protein [Paenibacillus sp. NEAU-GSW1]MUT64808.1 NAD-dependent epimerase/dehydratase family protein [Paenibacillus sp. NEAU-GSW1]
MKLKVIITGVTGMVGEGVLHECLQHPDVEKVLVLNRRPSGIAHPKMVEVVHDDFFNLEPVCNQLKGYNACFYCLGVTSIGLTEQQYARISYDLTLYVAHLLAELNPDLTFTYVSGSGTDSSEKGRSMWARVKGKTENELLRLPFRSAFMFRPGYIHPTKGLKNTHRYYSALSWMYPVTRRLFPGIVTSMRELGVAMIHAVQYGYNNPILENPDIGKLAASSGPAK